MSEVRDEAKGGARIGVRMTSANPNVPVNAE
jgi:hypothetical protein